jgi:hypothetical protein
MSYHSREKSPNRDLRNAELPVLQILLDLLSGPPLARVLLVRAPMPISPRPFSLDETS